MNTQYPPFSSFTTEENRCKTGECGPGNRTDGFDGNVTETLWNILPRLNATHAFVNLGWEAIYGFEAQSDFSCEMQEFERQHPSTQLYLMSHPPPKSVIDNPLASFDAKKLKCDVGVLDRSITNKNVPHSWYWDFLHVLSILNEEYNHLLVWRRFAQNQSQSQLSIKYIFSSCQLSKIKPRDVGGEGKDREYSYSEKITKVRPILYVCIIIILRCLVMSYIFAVTSLCCLHLLHTKLSFLKEYMREIDK